MSLHKGTKENYSLGLFYIEPSNGEAPFNPIAHIYIQTFTRGGYKGAEDAIMITPRLMSEMEVDQHVSRLHAELDRIAIDAKRRLNAYYRSQSRNKS